MRFCVKCGKDCEEVIDGLCTDCFLEGRKLVSMPHHVNLQVCTNCGEYLVHDEWCDSDRMKIVEDIGISQMSVVREARVVEVGACVEEQDRNNYVVHVQASLEVSGVVVESECSVIVRIKNTVCKRCSRILGNYYESILQIRTNERDLSPGLRKEVLARVDHYVGQQSKTNRDIFVSKIESVQGGIDIYLSSIQLGKALAKFLTDSYSAETNEAAKLVGQTRDGQDMYRVTYLVRLPDFHVDDVVEFDGRNYVLTKVSNAGGRIIDLANFREKSIKRTEMNDLKVISKAEDLKDVTVISRSNRDLQVMHPTTYTTLDLQVPEGAAVGDTVKVVDIDGTLYYVPQRGGAKCR